MNKVRKNTKKRSNLRLRLLSKDKRSHCHPGTGQYHEIESQVAGICRFLDSVSTRAEDTSEADLRALVRIRATHTAPNRHTDFRLSVAAVVNVHIHNILASGRIVNDLNKASLR